MFPARGEPPGGGRGDTPNHFLRSGLLRLLSLQSARLARGSLRLRLGGSHMQKHQSNKNNTSLGLSVIGDLLRGNDWCYKNSLYILKGGEAGQNALRARVIYMG